MAGGARRITVEFLGKDVSAGKAAKGVESKITASGNAAEASGKKFGAASSGFKKMVGAFAGIAVISKATTFLKESVAEAREAQKVSALTTQVIKTTGGAAKVTAQQVGDLATAISNKSGIDDEAIQSGANLLLTFKNIKNEAGAGNDIFNQTTQIMTDMGAAMGKEPKAAAIALGKALNDPIKGVTALSKVGVTFDESQKALIKRLVETGDVAGAQKIILKELKSEFGGAAAASSTAGEKAAVAWGNLKEQIGTKLLPVIDRLATWFSTKAVPAISRFADGMKSGEGSAGAFGKVLNAIGTVVRSVGGWIGRELVPFIKDVVASFRSADKSTGGWKQKMADLEPFIRVVKAALKGLWEGIKLAARVYIPVLVKWWSILAKGLGLAGKQAIWLWNGAFAPALRFITKGVGTLMNQWAGMLRALGRIPGFGWARDAAEKMQNAANKALGLSRAIKDIPPKKTSTVTTNFITNRIERRSQIDYGTRTRAAGTNNLPRARARGGHVIGGQEYRVNERGQEFFRPSQSGRVVPAAATKRMGGGGDSFEVSAPVILQMDGRAVWQGLLKVKRQRGNVSLGLG